MSLEPLSETATALLRVDRGVALLSQIGGAPQVRTGVAHQLPTARCRMRRVQRSLRDQISLRLAVGHVLGGAGHVGR
jgi:hypothetical protein